MRYHGLRRPAGEAVEVHAGRAARLRVPDDSIVSIADTGGTPVIWLAARRGRDRVPGLAALGLGPRHGSTLDGLAFDAREMAARCAARGGALGEARGLRIAPGGPEAPYVVRLAEAADLYVVVPVPPNYVEAGGGGRVRVTVSPPPGAPPAPPEPLGRVVDEFRVERGSARAYELRTGQFVQVIDLEGQQCSDFMAMRTDALDRGEERFIDGAVTRTMTRSAYPLPGLADTFYDQDMRPLLAARRDTVGRHDTFALACTARGYEERGFPGHLNCSDNISDAYAPHGIARRPAWPAVNFFFNSWIDWRDHVIASDEAWSRPGDYVCLQALTDLVCVSTACPDDIDPINGWNPTDIHVRIYEEDTAITHSVSWRAQPDDAPRLTRHSAFHARTSTRTTRFHVARDLWLPAEYDATGAVGEYWATKRAATLQDMSGLRKLDVVGPDAEALLNWCLTRDVSKLSEHRGLYALICDARGAVLDDGTLFRLERTAFRWCCGSDVSALHLREQAEAQGFEARVLTVGERMANLALQGPRARDILWDVVFTQPTRPALENLKWFGFTVGRLHDREGPAVMVTRTGFTGELGYEVFCDADDALAVWDGLMEAGAPHGLVPMGGAALEMLRIEAGLMVAGAEFGPDTDAFESGLGFAVALDGPDFLGRAALARNAAAPRRRLMGLHLAGAEAPAHGDGVFRGRERVGTVTSAAHSPHLGHAIAMARLAVEDAEAGTVLEVGRLDGHMKRLPCTVAPLPFLDPKREKARA